MERRRHLIYTSWLNSGLYPNQLVLEVIHRFWIYFLESWITKLQKALPVWAPVPTLNTEDERILWWSWLKPRESLSYPAMEKVVCRGNNTNSHLASRKIKRFPCAYTVTEALEIWVRAAPDLCFYWSLSPKKGEAETNPHLWRKNVSQKALLICLAIAIPSKQKKGPNQHLISKH